MIIKMAELIIRGLSPALILSNNLTIPIAETTA